MRDQGAGVGVAWNDCNFPRFRGFEGCVADIEAQVAFAVVGILTVAVEAVFGKNRADLSIEIHFSPCRVGQGEGAHGKAEEHP